MSQSNRTNLGGVELEPRVVPQAGAGHGPAAVVAQPAMNEAERATITAVETEPAGGQVRLTVRVAEGCPACLLRVAGTVRAVGGGMDQAEFLVSPGSGPVVVEMTDPAGEFQPVLHVQLPPVGHETSSAESAGEHDAVGMMPAGDDMSDVGDMASHAEMDTDMPAGAHESAESGHGAEAVLAHAALMPAHLTRASAVFVGAGHAEGGPAISGEAPAEGHAAGEADLFAELPGVALGGPAEDHDPMPAAMDDAECPGWSVFGDDPETLPITYPVLPPPPVVEEEMEVADESLSPVEEDTARLWPTALGGTAAAILFAGSVAAERRARRMTGGLGRLAYGHMR